ncbi:MAG: molybdopterin-dependent oxidoreductase [Parasporobacterium sp.]|nr:molybdopterin-dependent oxidoreductase [Parasporobacterium sp.]
MTEQELLLRAKLPGADTGIEIKHSVCDICTPGPQCGINAYIKDGEIVKIEGMPGFPGSGGVLCTKGAANRQYVYRKERIKTPLKRVGERGSRDFVPISWDEAYDIIEENLSNIRKQYGPESVVWFTGYTKWIRPWLRRLCHSFGGHNYMTESSTCFRAGRMANETIFGRDARGDVMGAPHLMVGWGSNPFINAYPMGRGFVKSKEAGTKIIIVDVRHTQAAEKLADLFLQPNIGTDAVLAHAIANIIIQNGWQDQEFIDSYVHGFDDYRKMVSQYDLETAEKITGVPARDIFTAADWIAHIKPTQIGTNNGIAHHTNGFNTHRAIMCLNLITGNYDKPGTTLPVYDTFCDMGSGFDTHEEEFMEETRTPKTLPQIGEERFPLWNLMTGDAQAMDLTRQLLEGTPYKLHALCAFGMNTMMFPETPLFRKALKTLDFMMATDLVWTDACSYADIVLPVCSSLERSEVKCYPGGFFYYTNPAIEPLYESRNDVEIMTELARRLCPEDKVLCSGYHECIKYMFREMTDEIEKGHETGLPVRSSHFRPYIPGTYLKNGPSTPSGKLELYSELIAGIDPSYGLDPLPSFYNADRKSCKNPVSADSGADNTCIDYNDISSPGCGTNSSGCGINSNLYNDCGSFTLMTGARLPHTIHSRGHKVPWLRSLRPDPMVDINPSDATRLGIAQEDRVRLFNDTGEISVLANVTEVANKGDLHLIHGYEEANATDLIPWDHTDPYSGFPGYKQVRVFIEKAD